MQLSEYHERIGLLPINRAQFDSVRKQHANHASVQEFDRLRGPYSDLGDRDSVQPFYRFLYSTSMPDLNILWSDAYAAMGSELDTKVFPEVARLCGNVSGVLEVGCGDGLLLCYLAVQHPDVSFVGMDFTAEAIALCHERIERLKLTNVTAVQADAFQSNNEYKQSFDRAILLNVIDDTRVRGSAVEDACFETTHKMNAIKLLLRGNAQVCVGLTADSEYARIIEKLEKQVFRDFQSAGFTGQRAKRLVYSSGSHARTHLMWDLHIDKR